jgi:hypothetical protein
MATPAELDQSWTKITTDVRLVACEEQLAELAELPIMPPTNDWTRTARDGIHDRRSRPDE